MKNKSYSKPRSSYSNNNSSSTNSRYSSSLKYNKKKIYKYIYNKKNKYIKRKYKNKYKTADVSYQFIKFNSSSNQVIIKENDIIKRKEPLLSNIGYRLELSYVGKRLHKNKKRKPNRRLNKRKKVFHGIESSIINGYQTIRIEFYKEIKCKIDNSGKLNVIPILQLDDINKSNINKYQKVLLNYIALDAIVYLENTNTSKIMKAFNLLFIKSTKENEDNLKYNSSNMVDSNNSIISRSTYTAIDNDKENRVYYSMNTPQLVNYQSSKTDYIINNESQVSLCLIPYNYTSVYTQLNNGGIPQELSFNINFNGYLILTFKI